MFEYAKNVAKSVSGKDTEVIMSGSYNDVSLEGLHEKSKSLNMLLSNFISYAPDFEDFILFFLFHDVHKGFYIDVGANDPNYFSVTKAFYQRGWNGINIEPLPDKHQLLNKFRHRDINLKLGAGKSEEDAELFIQGMSGFDDMSTLYNNKNSNNSKIIKIKIKTMSQICKMSSKRNSNTIL